jgi:DNA-binding NarL/FixJ family response regulator
LVDDHLIIGEAISHLLSRSFNLQFMGHFVNTTKAREILASADIDMVLLDISMHDENGIDFCKWLKQTYPAIKVLFFSMHFDELTIGKAIKSGGDGYITKNEESYEILKAIDTIMQGGYFYSKDIEQILLKRIKPSKSIDIPVLTEREKEVLLLLADGYSSKEIGDKIFLSNKTVDFHRGNLLLKFNAKNVVEVTTEALRYGIID